MIVKYSKKFPYAPYLNEDIGFEMEILENVYTSPEKVLLALSTMKAMAEKFFKESNPGLAVETNYAAIPGHPQETQVEKRIGLFTDDIISSPDLQTLESYKLLVKGKPHLEKAYDFRLKELQNK